jgi:hypothetical protein
MILFRYLTQGYLQTARRTSTPIQSTPLAHRCWPSIPRQPASIGPRYWRTCPLRAARQACALGCCAFGLTDKYARDDSTSSDSRTTETWSIRRAPTGLSHGLAIVLRRSVLPSLRAIPWCLRYPFCGGWVEHLSVQDKVVVLMTACCTGLLVQHYLHVSTRVTSVTDDNT